MSAASEDLINFDVIEGQKENIQALPSGRSAKKLADLFIASPLQKVPTPTETRNANDAVRAKFEAELASISECDDPLDIFDRYVRWTLDAYPSAQATPSSQLHTVLERATKTFVSSQQYRNDPRYLKLWLHFIRFFSDAPREAFVFLSRHGIGENLALYYEEFAEWLEGAGRWGQAEEVYKTGLEKEARPSARLLRKFSEFEKRRDLQPEDARNAPSSPALPVMRPALAAKVDPFASARAADPQAPQRNTGLGGATKSAKPKMSIFSDAGAAPSSLGSMGPESKGWESIGSLAERKKENTVEPKPWAGETLRAGGKKSAAPKMAVFRDPSLVAQIPNNIVVMPSEHQVTVHPQTKKRERVFVDLVALYPNPQEVGSELCFEEIWAANRGWLDRNWDQEEVDEEEEDGRELSLISQDVEEAEDEEWAPVARQPSPQKILVRQDTIRLDENGEIVERPKGAKGRKKRNEVNETQVIKAKLDSPSGPRMRKKQGNEPTMTMHTKAATEDIYDIFNQPLNDAAPVVDESGDDCDDYETDGDCTSVADSTGTTRQMNTSEAGEEEEDDDEGDEEGEEEEEEEEEDDDDEKTEAEEDEITEAKSITSEWTDFTAGKHLADIDSDRTELGENDVSEDQTTTTGHDDAVSTTGPISEGDEQDGQEGLDEHDESDYPPKTRTIFIPIPPEDYELSTRPYRDPAEMANNRLPFMTPITERTESSVDVDATRHRVRDACKTPSRIDSGVHGEEGQENDGDEGEEDEEEEETDDSAALTVALTVSSGIGLEPRSSPTLDVVETSPPPPPSPSPSPPPLPPPKKTFPVMLKKDTSVVGTATTTVTKTTAKKGPIIKDAQCNPVDEVVRAEILANMQPPLSSHPGFFDRREERYEKGGDIRKYVRAQSKTGKGDKTTSLLPPVMIELPGSTAQYTVRREIGSGAFAPVYLVENSNPDGDDGESDGLAVMGKGAFATRRREPLEALKMESPPSAWEFRMMRLAHDRLGPRERAVSSLSVTHELHLYRDEAFLILQYHAHGTLLDVVNLFRSEQSGVMDEQLAMFFAIELFRTVEALHGHGILHGDLKADNCMLRLGGGEGDAVPSSQNQTQTQTQTQTQMQTQTQTQMQTPAVTVALEAQYRADGSGGWAQRGVSLIDFGRGIDMRDFAAGVQFIADWKTSAQDCAEMREGRPWTWQIDYHGLAGIVHCLLFGRYMETVRVDSGPGAGIGMGGRKYRTREGLKRYWQTDIWADCFDVLLNPASHAAEEDGGRVPVLRAMKRVRNRMETWLEANAERGVGLKGLVAKVETWARGGRR